MTEESVQTNQTSWSGFLKRWKTALLQQDNDRRQQYRSPARAHMCQMCGVVHVISHTMLKLCFCGVKMQRSLWSCCRRSTSRGVSVYRDMMHVYRGDDYHVLLTQSLSLYSYQWTYSLGPFAPVRHDEHARAFTTTGRLSLTQKKRDPCIKALTPIAMAHWEQKIC